MGKSLNINLVFFFFFFWFLFFYRNAYQYSVKIETNKQKKTKKKKKQKFANLALTVLAKPKAIVVIPKFQPLPKHLWKDPSESAKYRIPLR